MPFPLPLAPFERLMYWDDRSKYPMGFEFFCEFSGPIDREKFEKSVSAMVERHPLLGARVKVVGGDLHWVLQDPVVNPIQWIPPDESIPYEEYQRPFDLRNEPGLRIVIHPLPNGHRIIWRIHHACCDGLAACRIIGDVLGIYHALCRGIDPDTIIRGVDQKQLLHRASFEPDQQTAPRSRPVEETQVPAEGLAPPPPTNWSARWYGLKRAVVEAVDFIVHPPAPIASCANVCATAATFPVVVQKFDETQYQAIRDAARILEVSVNDFVLACMFQTLSRWNQEFDSNKNRNQLRITMPTSLRQRNDRQMPAANRMSYAFLDRKYDECGDFTALVHGIRFASQAIRRYNLSRQFVETLAFLCRRSPWMVRQLLSLRRCHSTAVVSHLGDPSRRFVAMLPWEEGKIVAGEMQLESIYATPPIRRDTRLAVCLSTYGGCLTISGFVDPWTHSPEHGNLLLQRFADQVVRATGQSVAVLTKEVSASCP